MEQYAAIKPKPLFELIDQFNVRTKKTACALMLSMLFRARYDSPGTHNGVTLAPGQLVLGHKEIGQHIGKSVSQIRNVLQKLCELKVISTTFNQTGKIVTFVDISQFVALMDDDSPFIPIKPEPIRNLLDNVAQAQRTDVLALIFQMLARVRYHTPKDFGGNILDVGQLEMGPTALADRLGSSPLQVESLLRQLEELGVLSRKVRRGTTIITFENIATYIRNSTPIALKPSTQSQLTTETPETKETVDTQEYLGEYSHHPPSYSPPLVQTTVAEMGMKKTFEEPIYTKREIVEWIERLHSDSIANNTFEDDLQLAKDQAALASKPKLFRKLYGASLRDDDVDFDAQALVEQFAEAVGDHMVNNNRSLNRSVFEILHRSPILNFKGVWTQKNLRLLVTKCTQPGRKGEPMIKNPVRLLGPTDAKSGYMMADAIYGYDDGYGPGPIPESGEPLLWPLPGSALHERIYGEDKACRFATLTDN